MRYNSFTSTVPLLIVAISVHYGNSFSPQSLFVQTGKAEATFYGAATSTSLIRLPKSESTSSAFPVSLNMIDFDGMAPSSSSLLISFVTDIVVARIILLSTLLVLATLIFKRGAEEESVVEDYQNSYPGIAARKQSEPSTDDASPKPSFPVTAVFDSSVDTAVDSEPLLEAAAEQEEQPSSTEDQGEILSGTPPVITAKEKDLIQLRMEVSNTIESEQEKRKRLSTKEIDKATLVKESTTQKSGGAKLDKPSSTGSISTSEETNETVSIDIKPTKGRKRRLAAKVIKKVIMPWKAWKSL